MRWVIVCVVGFLLVANEQAAHAAHPKPPPDDVYLAGPKFQAGGLQFTVPAKWLPLPADNPARVGQWSVPPLRGEGEGGEVVVFFFGPGNGGSAKENIDAWTATMKNPAAGRPPVAEVASLPAGPFKVTLLTIFGTYSQASPLPGVPPRPRPDYGLLGAVIESPQGNLYWRFTGPEPLLTATLPLFKKVLGSVKPQDK